MYTTYEACSTPKQATSILFYPLPASSPYSFACATLTSTSATRISESLTET